ncbi:MAG: xanthine dehydrogenase family protein molybdopterin-binding subunit [Pseudolabrys sp.]
MKSESRNTTGIGAAVARLEDMRLVTGRGCYTDDVNSADAAWCYVLRSPHAHARITKIDTTAARAASGVLAILTGADVARENFGVFESASFPKRHLTGKPSYKTVQSMLVRDRVRFVGDRVALVVAETLEQAKDAADFIDVGYEPLPAVGLADALAPGANRVWDEASSNLSFETETGDRAAVQERFAKAAHVTTIRIHYPRVAPTPMEPRVAMATIDPTDQRLTVFSCCQHPFYVRQAVADVLGLAEQSIRVRALDIGGSFGMKGVYPEDILVAWAARELGRPVKWRADRTESFLSDTHGRHQIATGELALDRDGTVLAFRTTVELDIGAYLVETGGVPPHNAGISYPGPYRIPHVLAVARAVFTNSTPVQTYRGSGKPEASLVLERLMEKAARELDIDPVDMRRRNMIKPSEMPFQTHYEGYVYDCGDFEATLDKCLALADWDGFPVRRATSEARGLLRGIGIGMHCQRAGNASERMEIRVSTTGEIAVHAGTLSCGQGHETMYAQMVSQWFGVPLNEVKVFQGDTDKVLFGRGSYAQRSMGVGGSALKLAADEVIDKAKRLAGWMMEAAAGDVVFEDNLFKVVGTDRRVTWKQVATKSYQLTGLPIEFGMGLGAVATHHGPNTFPNGCIIAEVEIDPETGMIEIVRVSAIDDAGTPVNPLALDNQFYGSMANAVGEMLLERVVYEEGTGQMLTASFMDYAMPRARKMPPMAVGHAPVPTKETLLGTKGGSEAGNCGGPAAIVHAILDALRPFGIDNLPLPVRPEAVWRAIRDASGTGLKP